MTKSLDQAYNLPESEQIKLKDLNYKTREAGKWAG